MEGGFFFGLGGGGWGGCGAFRGVHLPYLRMFCSMERKNNGECKDILLPLYHDVNGLVRTKQIS